MLMFLDIFAALLAVTAAAVWLSTRGELLPNRGNRHSKVREA